MVVRQYSSVYENGQQKRVYIDSKQYTKVFALQRP